jgi:hypothetical protein
MIRIGSIVKCINADEDTLKKDELYTVIDITSEGNFMLEETTPPSPHTSFSKDRFEDTGTDVYQEMRQYVADLLEEFPDLENDEIEEEDKK